VALPFVFGKLKNWVIAAPAAEALLAPPPSSSPPELELSIPGQAQTNWCWAAVAQGVSDYYSNLPMTQCTLVGKVLKVQAGTDCCSNGGTSQCNRQWYLHKALETVGCLREVVPRTPGLVPLDDVKNEIDAQQPLGVRIEWTRGDARGGGHFVAIAGWRTGASGDPYVTVKDPWGPATETLPIAEFVNGYGTDAGTWTHSYFTAHPDIAAQLGGARRGLALTPDLLGG
jgi:hypothetical protein